VDFNVLLMIDNH